MYNSRRPGATGRGHDSDRRKSGNERNLAHARDRAGSNHNLNAANAFILSTAVTDINSQQHPAALNHTFRAGIVERPY
jgi:hypothetical protein